MDEWWDVVDADGAPTGRRHRRGDANWPVGFFHVAVATVVVGADGRILITQRAPTRDFPLAWELPGGSALAGETSSQAARGELREETGIAIAENMVELVGRFQETTALFDLYVTHLVEPAELDLQRSEVHDARWVDLGEIASMLERGLFAAPWYARFAAFYRALAERKTA